MHCLLASYNSSFIIALSMPFPMVDTFKKMCHSAKKKSESQSAMAGRLAPWHVRAAEADTLSLINSGSFGRVCDVTTRRWKAALRDLAVHVRLNPFQNYLGRLLMATRAIESHEERGDSSAPGTDRQIERQREMALLTSLCLGPVVAACMNDLSSETNVRRATQTA